MRLLAIETATEACSTAVWVDGAVTERFELTPRRHAERILPMAEAVLAEAGLDLGQLDGLAFGRGPGAFTSVRIAAGVIQGMALGTDLPVVPVSTLAALAQGALDRDPTPVLAALDARLGEVYWGAFEPDADGNAQLVGAEQVGPPAAVALPPTGIWRGVGPGWAAHGEVLAGRLVARLHAVCADTYPRAGAVARLGARGLTQGRGVAADEAQPVYLRDKVVAPTAGKAGG